MTLQEQIAQLQAENAVLKAKNNQPVVIGFKVADKSGAVSVTGLQRFPVTLYKEQWEVVLAHGDQLKAFMKANESRLTTLEGRRAAKAAAQAATTIASTTVTK